jgi:hypothetical protein
VFLSLRTLRSQDHRFSHDVRANTIDEFSSCVEKNSTPASVDGATLTGLIRDAVREFHRHGVKRLVIVVVDGIAAAVRREFGLDRNSA